MAGGKKKSTTTTDQTQTQQQTQGPWGPAQPLFLDLYQRGMNALNQTNGQVYGGPLVAGPTADQRTAQGMARDWANSFAGSGAANNLMNLANGVANGSMLNPATSPFGAITGREFTPGGPQGKLSTDILNGNYLNANPYLEGAITAAIDPLNKNFQRTVIPSIQDANVMNGAYGGSGTGYAQQAAAADLNSQIGNLSSMMSYQNYRDERSAQNALLGQMLGIDANNFSQRMGLDAANYGMERSAQLNAPALYDAAFNIGTKPASLLDMIGGQQQQWDQQAIAGDRERWDMQQQAPWRGLAEMMGLLTAGGFGEMSGTSRTQGTQTQTVQEKANPFTSILQGAAGLAGLATGFPGLMSGLGGGLSSLLGMGAGAAPFALASSADYPGFMNWALSGGRG